LETLLHELVRDLLKIKRAGSVHARGARLGGANIGWRPRLPTKNKHLLAIYSIPARGFTTAVSVFRGTPPTKPFNCKIWSKRSGAGFGDRWADPIGWAWSLCLAKFSFAPVDIIPMSVFYYSQLRSFRFVDLMAHRQQKTLLTRGKQGLKILWTSITCLPPVYPMWVLDPIG